MNRTRPALYRAKTKRMYCRDGNRHKTPAKVFSLGVLTKQDYSEPLRTKFGLCRKGLRVAEYPTDIEVIIK